MNLRTNVVDKLDIVIEVRSVKVRAVPDPGGNDTYVTFCLTSRKLKLCLVLQ